MPPAARQKYWMLRDYDDLPFRPSHFVHGRPFYASGLGAVRALSIVPGAGRRSPGLLPGAPSIQLDPSLALAIFVAPVLLMAAFETSLRDLHDYRLSIITLVVIAVGVTTAAVAIAFHTLAPDVPWAAAVALGAIVAPPDAAAATAVLRGIKIPSRVLTILEGESLFNDASALLIFAVALHMAEDGNATLASLIPGYAARIIGSIALGMALSRLVPFVLQLAGDGPASIILQFCSTFGIWILAETVQLSAILTVVAYGMALARRGARRSAPLLRKKIVCGLGNGDFPRKRAGLHPHRHAIAPLLAELNPDQRASYFIIGATILATVIIVRILWVMTYNYALRAGNVLVRSQVPCAGASANRQRRYDRFLERHARDCEPRRGFGLAGRFSRARSRSICFVCCCPWHACDSRIHAWAACKMASSSRRPPARQGNSARTPPRSRGRDRDASTGTPHPTPMRFVSSIGLFLTFMKPGITAISSNSPIMRPCA